MRNYDLVALVVRAHHILGRNGKADLIPRLVGVVGHALGGRYVELIGRGKAAGGAVLGALVHGGPLHGVLGNGDSIGGRVPGVALAVEQGALHSGRYRRQAGKAVLFGLVELDLGQLQGLARQIERPAGGYFRRPAVGHHGAQGGQQVAVGIGGLHGKALGVGRDRVGHGGAARPGLAAYGAVGVGDHQRRGRKGCVQGVQVGLAVGVHPGLGQHAGVFIRVGVIKQVAGKEVAGRAAVADRHFNGQFLAEGIHQRQGVGSGLARPVERYTADLRHIRAGNNGLRRAFLAVGAAQHVGAAILRAGHDVEHQLFALIGFEVYDRLRAGDGLHVAVGIQIRRVQLKRRAEAAVLCLLTRPQPVMVDAVIGHGGPDEAVAELLGVGGVVGDELVRLADLPQAAQHGVGGAVRRADDIAAGAGGIAGDAQAHLIKAPAVAAVGLIGVGRQVLINIQRVAVGLCSRVVLYLAVGIGRQGDGLLGGKRIAVGVRAFLHAVQGQLVAGAACDGFALLGPGKGVDKLVAFVEKIGCFFRQLGGFGNPEKVSALLIIHAPSIARGETTADRPTVGHLSPIRGGGIAAFRDGKLQRGQVCIAVAAVAVADDFQPLIPCGGLRAAVDGRNGFAVRDRPAGNGIADAAVDRHCQDDPVVVGGKQIVRQVGKGNACRSGGDRALLRGKGDILPLQVGGMAVGIRHRGIFQRAAQQHYAVNRAVCGQAGKAERCGNGQLVLVAAGHGYVRRQRTARKAGVDGMVAVTIVPHAGDVDLVIILLRLHPLFRIGRGCIAAQRISAIVLAVRPVQRVGAPARSKHIVRLRSRCTCKEPCADLPPGNVLVRIRVFQHQHLHISAAVIRAVLAAHQAHFQLGGGQRLGKLLGCIHRFARACALAVYALDLDIIVFAQPAFRSLKGKAGIVHVGLQQDGAGGGAGGVGLVNFYMVRHCRAAGFVRRPADHIAAIHAVVVITAVDRDGNRRMGGSGVQQIGIVILYGFVRYVVHRGAGLAVCFLIQQQQLAHVTVGVARCEHVLGQRLGGVMVARHKDAFGGRVGEIRAAQQFDVGIFAGNRAEVAL